MQHQTSTRFLSVEAVVVCSMPGVTLALPSSLLWVGAAAERKEEDEGSPCSLSCWRLYLLCHKGTAEIQVLSEKLVLSGGKSMLGPPSLEPCTRPLFQRDQISWSAARESKLTNFPLHGPSHLTDPSTERFSDISWYVGRHFPFSLTSIAELAITINCKRRRHARVQQDRAHHCGPSAAPHYHFQSHFLHCPRQTQSVCPVCNNRLGVIPGKEQIQRFK